MREQSPENYQKNFERASRPDAGPSVAATAGTVCLSALFLAILYTATLLKLAPAKQTLGWALAYTLISIAPPLVLSLLEHVTRPAGPRKSARKWVVHFQIMLANYASGIPFALLATYLASLLVKSLELNLGLVDLSVGDGKTVISIAAALVVASLAGDFFFYWYHRSLHRSTILWQHHKMHHLDPEFDALTGPRQNWLENFFIVFFISIPVAVLFKLNNATDPLGAGLTQGAMIGFWTLLNFQNHSNLRLQFGKATVLFTSSQSHRIHHSYLPQHRDKNFVAFFPIWDILFGTYYHPARDEFPLTGVEDENDIDSVWEAQIFALREWWKMYYAHREKRTAGK
jgi:sterol desaturase/sphingolipid hydroxylase (fatty acid hydroxylase superfamily)